jgi:hypothetical protein
MFHSVQHYRETHSLASYERKCFNAKKGEHTGSPQRIRPKFSLIFNPTNPYNLNPSEDLILWFWFFQRRGHLR